MDKTQIILSIVIICILAIAGIIYLAWQIKKKGLKEVVITFIIKAEDMWEQGQNTEKLNDVIDKTIELIPMPLSLFITRDTVNKFVQSTFDTIKKALDYVPKKGVN